MPLPRLTMPSARAALHRPAVLVPVTALALAGLLGAGLLVANAVDAPPTSPTSASASPEPTPSTGAATSEAGTAEPTGDGVATTTSGGDDNVAVAVNTRDGSTVYALRLKVVITDADVVDSGNAAVAAASCSDCQTVAIALEGVIVTGDAEVVAPENIALAINTECSNCSTLAYAYQNLQTVDGKVRLTGEGRRRIALLRQQLNGLRTSGLDILAVKQEVDRIAGEFAAVLDSEVVPITRPAATASPTPGAPTPGAQTSRSPSADEPGADDPGAQTSSPAPTASADQTSATPSPTPTPSGG